MIQITKWEVDTLLNILRELASGSEYEDIEDDVNDAIAMLEGLLTESRDEG